MGLFSTLSISDDSESPAVSCLSVPAVVQLYTEPKPIQLESTTEQSSHGLLSFQAVPVRVSALNQVDTDEGNNSFAPDLGVWSCRVHQSTAGSLLPIPNQSNVFIFAVDLADFSQVEPTVTILQQALIRHLIQKREEKREVMDTQKTSLFDLRSTTFGLAPEDSLKTEQAAPDETDRTVKICLSICAKLPPVLSKDDYNAAQSLQLAMYHLRRFATNIGASLSFIAPTAGGTTGGPQPSLTAAQLAYVWHELAQGKPVDDTTVSGEEKNEETAFSRFYGPKPDDLIESIWLRNAQYPGHWDAAKDSLWKVFPVETSVDGPTTEAESNGDQDWLSELQASLASVTETVKSPAPKKSSSKNEKKTPGKDVNDFFTSLLDK